MAAKVMAYVTSPTQKKLLNLSYDWLRTFLPHVLAKVNRVSYGLLSSADCAAAIEGCQMMMQVRYEGDRHWRSAVNGSPARVPDRYQVRPLR
jgi:hypothetical protein